MTVKIIVIAIDARESLLWVVYDAK